MLSKYAIVERDHPPLGLDWDGTWAKYPPDREWYSYEYKRKYVDQTLPEKEIRKICEDGTECAIPIRYPENIPAFDLANSGAIDHLPIGIKTLVAESVRHQNGIPVWAYYFSHARHAREIIQSIAPKSVVRHGCAIIHRETDGEDVVALLRLAGICQHVYAEYDIRSIVPDHFQ